MIGESGEINRKVLGPIVFKDKVRIVKLKLNVQGANIACTIYEQAHA